MKYKLCKSINLIFVLLSFFLFFCNSPYANANTANSPAPAPLLKQGAPVKWWFVFKFNSAAFPQCANGAKRECRFGGDVQNYKLFSQQFAYASSKTPFLQDGRGCAGETTTDPLGATFDEIYNGAFHYVVWNDQFYDAPVIHGCKKECGSPWGHSKGLLAWNDDGRGIVLQVSTPSWPASGSCKFPRQHDGNTLGCVVDDDIKVSQHFFALKLTKDDVVKVLKALQNASVVTDIENSQIVNNGGPSDIQDLVRSLGKKSVGTTATSEKLSSGVILISKPSHLAVPPWQMVSALLDGVSLRTATWWMSPKISTTVESSTITCWDGSLKKPGPVEIATSGTWEGKKIGLMGGGGGDFNHAKVGISTSGVHNYVIFGDMNQQGALSGTCSRSQNGRGGLFYALDNKPLHESVKALLNGETAPAGR
jgi:hypothetical protein